MLWLSVAATRLGLGERGTIEVAPYKRDSAGKWKRVQSPRSAERFRARCYYRGMDGVLREISRVAGDRDAAAKAVQEAFEESLFGASDEMTSTTPLVLAGKIWLEGIARTDGGLAEKTVQDYRAAWYRCVDTEGSTLRGLTLDQANSPQRLRGFLRVVAESHGTGSAKMVRSALSGVLRLAVSNGALQTNALRQVGRVQAQTPRQVKRRSGVARDTSRAFTRAERDAIVAFADELAAAPDLNPRTTRKRESVADLIAFLSGTGVRIAEARRLDWSDVDLPNGRVVIRGTKSQAAVRTLDLPSWLIERMEARATRAGSAGFVFASPHHTDGSGAIEWDQSNLARAVAGVLAAGGYGWATPHSFRRTVATLAHQAGRPLVEIADQLGHADPSMTAKVYLGREPHGDRSALAAVL